VKIEPAILGKHYEAAAIEQMSQELEQEGYEVERTPATGKARFTPDLVVRRGSDTVVYEFKVVGGPDVRLCDAVLYAREIGARFRLILIRPQREMSIEVDGLNDILFRALTEPLHPDLNSLSRRTMVESIQGVEADAIHVEQSEIEVEGSAAVSVKLTAERGDVEVAALTLPFTFSLRLGTDQTIVGEPEIVVDTSEWTSD